MLVEPRVLDRDHRLAHHRRHVGKRHDDPVLAVEGRDERPVRGEDAGPLGQRRDLQLGRQVLEAFGAVAGHQADTADDRKDEPGDEQARQNTDDGEEHEASDESAVAPRRVDTQGLHGFLGYVVASPGQT